MGAVKVSDNQIQLAKGIDCLELAGRYVELKHHSRDEYCGPCPKCGGSDRFVVSPARWMCRQCSPYEGDAPGLLMFIGGLRFPEAVRQLTGDGSTLPPAQFRRAAERQPKPKLSPEEREAWRLRVQSIADLAHGRLMNGHGEKGAAYLDRRGIESFAWVQFRLGYGSAWSGVTGQMEPAIVMPWTRGGKLTAVRYRYLAPPGDDKIVSQRDSEFAGYLYGAQGLTHANGQENRWLVLCEGELNAVSIWQTFHEAGVDVLSLGGESQRLTDAMIAYAKKYRKVIVWMDEPSIVTDLMRRLPGAFGVNSVPLTDDAGQPITNGKGKPVRWDANDLLQRGLLGGMLAAAMRKACATKSEQTWLLDGISAAARIVRGVDIGAGRIGQQIAQDLGRTVKFYPDDTNTVMLL